MKNACELYFAEENIPFNEISAAESIADKSLREDLGGLLLNMSHFYMLTANICILLSFVSSIMALCT